MMSQGATSRMRPTCVRRDRGLVLAGCVLLAVAVGLCALAGGEEPNAAEPAEPDVAAAEIAGLEVTTGFAGVSKTATWTPVQIRVSSNHPAQRVRVWAADPEDQLVGSPWAELGDVANSRRGATLHVRLGRPDPQLVVELENSDGTLTRETREPVKPMPQSASLLLVLGDMPAAARGVRLLEDDDGWKPTVVSLAVEELPGASALDFDAADAVVVCGSICPLPSPVFRALDAWVQGGGRLVFLAGESLERLAAAGAAELNWLPARFERLVPLRSTAVVETFARASRPLASGGERLQMPLLAPLEPGAGTALAAVGPNLADLPLAVRAARGFGSVGWLAFDLDQGAFLNWPGSDSLLLTVLGRERARGGRSGETRRDLLDLGGQLRRSVDQFPGVKPVPFELIGLLAILFVACLYPLSWWLATPPSGRGGWIALGVAVVAFTFLASNIGGRWKASEWQETTAGLVDVDLASGQVRGMAMAGLWASANTTIRLAAEVAEAVPHEDDVRPVLSWASATGRSFGGPDTQVPHASLAAAPYTYGASLARLEGVPLAIATSGTWQAEWTARMPLPQLPLSGSFERTAEGTLRGALTSTLPFPLEGCLLAYAGWIYDVGSLPAGGSFDPSKSRGPRSLAGAIARRELVGEREQAGRYDIEERDADRILEVATFHEAAGGRAYTSLEAGLLGRYDLSDLIRSGRAVLVGRGPRGTEWTTDCDVNSEETPHSLWRFVLPVGQSFGPPPLTEQPMSESGVAP
jgi:hypothetical protein